MKFIEEADCLYDVKVLAGQPQFFEPDLIVYAPPGSAALMSSDAGRFPSISVSSGTTVAFPSAYKVFTLDGQGKTMRFEIRVSVTAGPYVIANPSS